MRNTRTGLSRREVGKAVRGWIAGRGSRGGSFPLRPDTRARRHAALRPRHACSILCRLRQHHSRDAGGGSEARLRSRPQPHGPVCGDRRLRIAARGQGHLPFGQAQVRSGIVVDMRTLNDIDGVHGEEIHVHAGCTWTAVANTALERGDDAAGADRLSRTHSRRHSVSRRNFTGYLALRRTGGQRHEVEVVTGQGDRMVCSETRNRELFQAVLAGQGQCAMMARATIRLVRAPEKVRSYVLAYADLPTLLRDLERMGEDGRFDGVLGYVVPSDQGWLYFMEG